MHYALIKNGVIERINIQLPTVIGNTSIPAGATGLTEFGLYPIIGSEPSYNPQTQRVSGPTYQFTGEAVERIYTVETIPLSEVQAQRLAELAAIRYQHETAGITLSGMTIETDRESQALITGAWSFSQLNPAVLIDWKATTGWIQIDAATIAGIAGAVAAHVQACFSAERAHAEAIAALETVDAVAGYDLTTGWPA